MQEASKKIEIQYKNEIQALKEEIHKMSERHKFAIQDLKQITIDHAGTSVQKEEDLQQ